MNWKMTQIDEVKRNVVDLAAELISIPSYQTESEVATFLAAYLSRIGCKVSFEEVEPRRPNILAVLEGRAKNKILMFCGHLDTVPPVSKEQLHPQVRNGKLYGRGSCDMKGALAAMVCALDALVKHVKEIAGTIVFLATMGEETGLRGMKHFVARSARTPKISACIVGEPTSFDVGIAHKGVAWIKIAARGKAAHASVPNRGKNAVYFASLIVKALHENLAQSLLKKTHPLLGPGTISAGVIKGGTRPNIVPDQCIVKVDRRWLPGESLEEVLNEIRLMVETIEKERPGYETRIVIEDYYPPFQIGPESRIVKMVKKAVCTVIERPPRLVGLPYGTDGALIQATQVPTIIVGPGNYALAHTEDEFIQVRELMLATQVYFEIAKNFLKFNEGSY